MPARSLLRRRSAAVAALTLCGLVGLAWLLRPAPPSATAAPTAASRSTTPSPRPVAAASPATPAAPSERELALRSLVSRGVATWTTDDYGRTTHHEFIALYPAWLRDDLVTASRAVLGLPANWDKREFLALATDAWLARDPAAAAAYAESLADDADLHSDALVRVATAWGLRDPAAASAWLTPLVSDPAAVRSVGELAVRWAENSPVAALAWTDSLPDGPARDRATLRGAVAWIERDPAAASRHFEALPAARQTDPVRAALSRAALAEDAGSAVLWARAIGDEALRRKVLLDTLPALNRQSPAAAKALADELRLSPEGLLALTGR